MHTNLLHHVIARQTIACSLYHSPEEIWSAKLCMLRFNTPVQAYTSYVLKTPDKQFL